MPDIPIRAAVLTVSDRCSRGERVDESGPAVRGVLERHLGASVVAVSCLPDERSAIRDRFIEWAAVRPPIDLVVSTGGTGLSPRDVTPEAAREAIDREAPGLMELARSSGAGQTPFAYLSRGVAGTRDQTLILTLPGSVRGATESLGALVHVLPHAIGTLRDRSGPHPAGPAAPDDDPPR